jgi:hypothetical protein
VTLQSLDRNASNLVDLLFQRLFIAKSPMYCEEALQSLDEKCNLVGLLFQRLFFAKMTKIRPELTLLRS